MSDSRARLDPLAVGLVAIVEELGSRDSEVRRDEEDAVHKMRVASRRLRSLLGTYRRAFHDGVIDMRCELRWLGNELGVARDAEVLLAEFHRDALLGEGGAHRTSLEQSLNAEVRASRTTLRAALDSPRYERLLESLEAFATCPPFTEAHRRSSRALGKALGRRIRKVERLVDSLDLYEGAERDEVLHEIRKRAKHVRYGAELLALSEGKRAQKLADRYAAIQTALGHHHDAVLERHLAVTERDASGPGNTDAFWYGVVYARAEIRAEAAEAEFWQCWKRANHRSLRRWIS